MASNQKALFGNQLGIKINLKKTEKFYLHLADESVKQALRKLTSTAGFKVYIYLANINAPKEDKTWEWHLSSKVVCEELNIGIGAYNSAIKELKDVGYLQQIEGNHYQFNDYLKVEK